MITNITVAEIRERRLAIERARSKADTLPMELLLAHHALDAIAHGAEDARVLAEAVLKPLPVDQRLKRCGMTEDECDEILRLIADARSILAAVTDREEREVWGTNAGKTRTQRGRHLDKALCGLATASWETQCAWGECPRATA